jgi:flagellin-like hook-associated protein FlgL
MNENNKPSNVGPKGDKGKTMNNGQKTDKKRIAGLPWNVISILASAVIGTLGIHIGIWQFYMSERITTLETTLLQRLELANDLVKKANGELELAVQQRDSLIIALDSTASFLNQQESDTKEYESFFEKWDTLLIQTTDALVGVVSKNDSITTQMDECEHARERLNTSNGELDSMVQTFSLAINDVAETKEMTKETKTRLEIQQTAITEMRGHWVSDKILGERFIRDP